MGKGQSMGIGICWLGGQYQSIRILSRSGFNETHLVVDQDNPTQPYCVLKYMPLAGQPSMTQALMQSMFRREVSVLQTLPQDGHFPKLLNVQVSKEALTLIHNWLPGATVQEEFASGRLWTQAEVVAFLVQSLQILDNVHQLGFLHGDLKPAHWIRTPAPAQLSLIDFGAARCLDQIQNEESIHHEFSLGTLGYMAPEQAQGRPRPSSDLYALGMIVLQGVTGLLPSQLPQNQQGEWQWHSSLDLQPALIDILTRLVRYRWQDRYATVSEVLMDLKPLTHNGWQRIWGWFSPAA